MLRHVVSWKLATDDPQTKAEHTAEIRRRLDGLVPIIPELRQAALGTDTGDTSGNWDLVLVADYDDEQGLAAYQTHPEHQKVAAYIRSVVSDRSCVDYRF
jgi:hypothetical protein